MTVANALLITRDETLLEDVLRLAAAAGSVLDVAHDAVTAMRSWSSAAVVLVGADLADLVAGQHPVRRDHVHVIGHVPMGDQLFRSAIGVGASGVLELPTCESWLVELLTDILDGKEQAATTVGVIGGSGGAGATTFACALALMAALEARTALIDMDPLGPGVDRVVGLDEADGVRWDALADTTGRLGSRSLRAALPQKDGLAVLTWAPGVVRQLEQGSVREVLAAAQRGNDVVVVDLPRHSDDASLEVISRCNHVVMVSSLTVPGVAAAGRVAARLREVTRAVHVVARGRLVGVSPEEVAETLGMRLLGSMPDQRHLAEHIDLGLGPVHARRGPLARTTRAVCAQLVPRFAESA